MDFFNGKNKKPMYETNKLVRRRRRIKQNKKMKLKIKTKMLYVKHKNIFVKNFKSNIYFFLPQKTRGPVNRSLGPTKTHT